MLANQLDFLGRLQALIRPHLCDHPKELHSQSDTNLPANASVAQLPPLAARLWELLGRHRRLTTGLGQPEFNKISQGLHAHDKNFKAPNADELSQLVIALFVDFGGRATGT